MKKIVALLLVISTVFAFAACGKTADGIDVTGNNQNISQNASEKTDKPDAGSTDVEEQPFEKELEIPAPSEKDLESLGLDKAQFQYPAESEYLSSFDSIFTKTSTGIFPNDKIDPAQILGKLAKGQQVKLIAIKEDMGLVMAEIDVKQCAGWLKLEFLSYWNPENDKKATEAERYSTIPTITTVHNRGLEKTLTLPDEKEYASSFDQMYVSTSTYVLSRIEGKNQFSLFDMKKGSIVDAIAYRDKYALILAETDAGEKIGWIERDFLRYDDPEEKIEIVKAKDYSGTPSVNDIENLGLQKSITIPDDEYFIACYDKMFIAPSSIPVLSIYDKGQSFIEAQLVKGSEVNLIAIKEKYALILFDTAMGEKAGWISLADLSYNDPRNDIEPSYAEMRSGKPGVEDIERLGLEKSITVPKDDWYTSCYDRMFITPSQVKVYSYEESGIANSTCLLAKESEVNVIAINGKSVCILFDTDEGEKCGWIKIESLSYNDPQKKPEAVKGQVHSGKPSIKDIENLGLEKSMTVPEDEMFISCYDRMYTTPASLYVYSFEVPKKNIYTVVSNLYVGSEVSVIAINNENACIIYETDMGTRVGWVSLEALSYNDPTVKREPVKAKQYSGTPSAMDIENLGLEKSITMPADDSYISIFSKMYTTVGQQVLSFSEKNRDVIAATLERNSEVMLIAIENRKACIIYETDEGTKVGWMPLENLSYNSSESAKTVRTAGRYSGVPSAMDVEYLGLEKCVTMPEETSYISCFDNMYANISSIQILSFDERDRSMVVATAPLGSEVTVLAIQNGKAFVFCETDAGTRCGWTLLQNLSYNNPLNSLVETYAMTPSGTPGIQDIEETGMEKSMTLPDDNKYLDAYETKVVSGNTPVNSFNDRHLTNAACTIAKGSEVVVIARQSGCACVLYETDQGTEAGWIMESTLRDIS